MAAFINMIYITGIVICYLYYLGIINWGMPIYLLLVIIGAVIIYDRKCKNYWKSKGVYSPPSTFILGHLNCWSSSPQPWELIDKYYKTAKLKRMFGLYEMFTPKIVITDPNLLEHVLKKDFDHFVDRRALGNTSDEDKIIRSMILNLCGDRWKAVRNVIRPVFSSGKLKDMLTLIEMEADRVVQYCRTAALNGASVNMVTLNGKYALNVVQAGVFGMEGESFSETQTDLFHQIKDICYISPKTRFKFVIANNISIHLFNLLGLSVTTDAQKNVSSYMKKLIAERRTKPSTRADFLSNLMDAQVNGKRSKDGTYHITDDVIIAQLSLFMFVGFDTIKNNLSFALHHLAKYPKEQGILRKELNDVGIYPGEHIAYGKFKELHHLNAFIMESMRIFPTAYMLERCCTKDYKIPGTDVIIPKGMVVGIPTYSIHHDSEYWKDPESFQPSRFLSEKNAINAYTHLPFGTGLRGCLGKEFALLQMKIMITRLLLSFKMRLKPNTELVIAKTFMAHTGQAGHLWPDHEDGVHIDFTEL